MLGSERVDMLPKVVVVGTDLKEIAGAALDETELDAKNW